VAIRERTKGKSSLPDALRAIVASGGSIAERWPVEKVIEIGDRATGTTVLRETYDSLARHPTPVDLPTLWSRLGVTVRGEDSVTFDDAADLAWVRKAITPAR
jgi:predicted metalloprotease with PDZ domain